jgi:uncharacterized membrane protein YidH (DUF202 family)
MKNGSVYSALGAVGSALAASSCCLPLGTFWLAAGTAGASAILDKLRPYLIALSVILIVFGFWQAHRAKKCNRKRSVFSMVLLWSAALFVFVSIAFPQVLADIFAG